MRVLLMELNRISSHLTAIGTFGLELGATTVFLYGMREREKTLDLFELITGLRMNHAYIRPGGVSQDLPAGAIERLREYLRVMPGLLGEIRALLDAAPVYLARTRNIAHLDVTGCMSLGVTGPILRAAGLPWDLRKSQPYCGYETYEFDVPTQQTRRRVRPVHRPDGRDGPVAADHRASASTGWPASPAARHRHRSGDDRGQEDRLAGPAGARPGRPGQLTRITSRTS